MKSERLRSEAVERELHRSCASERWESCRLTCQCLAAGLEKLQSGRRSSRSGFHACGRREARRAQVWGKMYFQGDRCAETRIHTTPVCLHINYPLTYGTLQRTLQFIAEFPVFPLPPRAYSKPLLTSRRRRPIPPSSARTCRRECPARIAASTSHVHSAAAAEAVGISRPRRSG